MLAATFTAADHAQLFVLLGSSLLNVAYLFPIIYKAFFCTEEESLFENKVQEAPLWCVAPLVFTAAVSLFLFFFPEPFFRLAVMAVQTLRGG